MRASNLHQALTSPETFTLIPGVGYVDLRQSPPARPGGPRGACFPPPATANMSWHTLASPHGDAVNFQWMDRNRIWLRVELGARRIAFNPDYLSSHGWAYAGPAQGRHE